MTSKQYYKINKNVLRSIFGATTFIVLFLIIIIISNGDWKKIFGIGRNNTAAVFATNGTWNSGSNGTWNSTTTWGTNGGIIPLNVPYNLVLSPSEELYIVDQNNSRIVVLNSDGTASTTYDLAELLDDINSTPYGVSVYQASGKTYVADSNNNKIVVLNSDGTLFDTYGGSTLYDGNALSYPRDVKVSVAGDIYVADIYNDRIVVLDSSGVGSTTYPLLGDANALVISPTTDNIYVSDITNNQIVVLTNGTTTANYDGTSSSTLGTFYPYGVALDSSDNIYIADYNNNRIVILDSSGNVLAQYGDGLGLNGPTGVAVSSSGDIFITDSNNNRIVVLDSNGTLLTNYDGTALSGPFVPVEGSDYPGPNNDATIDTGTVTLTQNQSVKSLTFGSSDATLDLNGFTLNVYGNWNNTAGGTVTDSTTSDPGTVNFTGTSTQTIFGANTFPNLKRISTSASTSLLFDFNATTTVTGAITLTGTSGNLLNIGPSSGSFTPVFDSIIGGVIAGFSAPEGIEISPTTGNIYVADYANSRIVVLNPDGSASTTYDNLDSTNPTPGLAYAEGLTLSTTGEIYIADTFNNRVVVLNANGTASTTYDTTTFASSTVTLDAPSDLKISSIGEIYIVDQNNDRIVVLNSNGSVSRTFDVGLNGPIGITLSGTGESYVTDSGNHNIVVINADGTASSTFSVNISSLTPNTFNFPKGITRSPSGEIYIADPNNNRIVVLNPDGVASTTYDNLDASYLPAGFNYPIGVALSSTGRIYVTDENNSRVVLLNANGTASTTYDNKISGNFLHPQGIARDTTNGNFYVVDSYMNNIQKFNAAGTFQGFLDTNTGVSPALSSSYALAVDSRDHSLYLSEYGYGRIIKFDASGNYATTTNFALAPLGIAVDSQGFIYVQDESTFPSRLIKLDPDLFPAELSIVASTTDASGDNGGGNDTFDFCAGELAITPDDAYLYSTENCTGRVLKIRTSDLQVVAGSFGTMSIPLSAPTGVALDSEGNVYVADENQPYIVKFTSNLSVITSFGESGTSTGQLNGPAQIMIDSNDKVYVTDADNSRVEIFKQGPPPAVFKILHTGPSSSRDFSFLNVFGSNNISADASTTPFDCTNGCTDGGLNTGWLFATTTTGGHHPGTPPPVIPPPLPIPTGTSTPPVITTVPTVATIPIQNASISTTAVNSFTTITVGPAVVTTTGVLKTGTLGTTTISSSTTTTTTTVTPTSTVPSSTTTVPQNVTTVTGAIDEILGGNVVGGIVDLIKIALTSIVDVTQVLWNGVVDTVNNILKNILPGGTQIPVSTQPSASTTPQNVTTLPGAIDEISGGNVVGGIVDIVKVSLTNLIDITEGVWNNVVDTVITIVNSISKAGNPLQTSTNPTSSTTTEPSTVTSTSTTAVTSTSTGSSSTTTESQNPTTITDALKEIVNGDVLGGASDVVKTVLIDIVNTTNNVIDSITGTNSNPTQENIIAGISDTFKSSFSNISGIKDETFANISTVANNPTISIIAKILGIVGLVLGAAFAIGTLAFAGPVEFNELWVIPSRFSSFIFGLLGIKKKNRPWGTVYDAVTKRPLDPAYVSLIDLYSGKEVASAITDLDGRYGFSVIKGTYKIVAMKTNYVFPSVKMAGNRFDDVYNDLYFGEDILVTKNDEVITKNIPMDPTGFDWNEFTKNKSNINVFIKGNTVVWARISKIFFILGTIVSILAAIFAPEPYNFIILGLYVIGYALRFTVIKVKKAGMIKDKNGDPLAFAVVTIFREGEASPITKKIADKFGGYYALVPKGKYFMRIEKKNDDESYTQVLTTPTMNAENGILNSDFTI